MIMGALLKKSNVFIGKKEKEKDLKCSQCKNSVAVPGRGFGP